MAARDAHKKAKTVDLRMGNSRVLCPERGRLSGCSSLSEAAVVGDGDGTVVGAGDFLCFGLPSWWEGWLGLLRAPQNFELQGLGSGLSKLLALHWR